MTQEKGRKQAGLDKWLDITVEHIKWDEPKEITGKLIEIQENSTGFPFFIFEDDEKKRFGVIGTTQLSNYINKKMMGNLFLIEYMGEVPTSDGEKTIKNFKVKTRKP